MSHGGATSGVAAIALMVALAGATLDAQVPAHLRDYPLASLKPSGDLVAPFFDGWYDNGDGTVTYAFGFLNRNTEELVDIPLGPNNRIEPVQYDGLQPTHFPVFDRGGFHGRRERQVFGVTLPMDGTEVVWTLTHAGRTYSVPGRATSPAYEMSRGYAAFGSMHPAVRFDPEGPEAQGAGELVAERVTAQLGTPVTLSALVQDRGEREGLIEPDRARSEYDTNTGLFPVTATWFRHQGPGEIHFEPASSSVGGEGWGVAATEATFTQAGEYMVRLRVDNFMAPDSKFDNQCCWTSVYVPVTVR